MTEQVTFDNIDPYAHDHSKRYRDANHMDRYKQLIYEFNE